MFKDVIDQEKDDEYIDRLVKENQHYKQALDSILEKDVRIAKLIVRQTLNRISQEHYEYGANEFAYETKLIRKLKDLSSHLQKRMAKYGDRYGKRYNFERYDELQSVVDAINQIIEGDD